MCVGESMSEQHSAPRILIVDPDAEFLRTLAAEAAASPDPCEVIGVADPAAAVAMLARDPVDAVGMSLALSDDQATDLVGEIEARYPGLPLVAIAARVEDAGVARACHCGATSLLVRPFPISALRTAIAAPPADAGFGGSCQDIPTAHVLTLHSASGQDGILHLRCGATATRPERIGSIYLEAGQPVHATAGSLVGSEAVHAMLGWVDAEASWLPGHPRCARTIVGRWEGVLVRGPARANASDPAAIEAMVAVAYPEVVEKLSRLAQTPDVLGAFLLRHAEVVAGRCTPELDEQLASRALRRLSNVFFDVDAQEAADAGREIQAIVGTMRLVLDRIGPAEAGFQVGVLVRQAAPVCKSLRRLLRQIDSAFDRAVRSNKRGVPTPADLDLNVQRVA